jgi:hypothetical protein
MAVVWDVFDGAVRVLVGCGPVKQRLIDAWRDHLAPLHDKDLPEALRADLGALRAAMHASAAAGGMGAAEVSVRKMSEKEAAEHAVRIFEMHLRLVSNEADSGNAPRLRIVGDTQQTDAFEELPAFLSRA